MPPVLRAVVEPQGVPPKTIISLPVQTAEWAPLAEGAPDVFVAVHASAMGS